MQAHSQIDDIERAQQLWKAFHDKYQAVEQDFYKKVPAVVAHTVNEAANSELEAALHKGDWSDNIFNDKDVPHYALSLHLAGRIDFHQFCTVMERWQTFPDFPHLNTYPILDEKGDFTKEAEQLLLPTIQSHLVLKALDADQLTQLKHLIAALPKSEQIFYTTGVGKLKEIDQKSLAKTLNDNGLIPVQGDCLVETSTGVFDAIGLARFGLAEYVRPVHRLGAQGINDIEEGMRAFARITALNFPGTVPYEKIHDYDNVTNYEATKHDKYHAMVVSSIPKPILHAIFRMVDVARQETNIKWSKELWALIDCEFNYAMNVHGTEKLSGLSDKEMTELFCTILQKGNNATFNNGGYAQLIKRGEVSPLLTFILLDMCQHAEVWQQHQIVPDHLVSHLKEIYDEIKVIYHQAPQASSIVHLLKYESSNQIKIETPMERLANDIIKTVSTIIDENAATLASHAKFKRKTNSAGHAANTVYLEYSEKNDMNDVMTAVLMQDYANRFVNSSEEAQEEYARHILSYGESRLEAESAAKDCESGEDDCLDASSEVTSALRSLSITNSWSSATTKTVTVEVEDKPSVNLTASAN